MSGIMAGLITVILFIATLTTNSTAKEKKMFIKDFESIDLNDLSVVGGKNASLGEMIKNLSTLDIKVPSGFVITVEGYKHHLKTNNLESKISELLKI